MKLILIAIFIVGLMVSCKHEPPTLSPAISTISTGTNNQNNNGGGNNNGGNVNTCDTNIIYFNQDILPILVSNCAKSGCHDVASHEEGIILNSYVNVMTTADVEPFNLSAGDLFEVITTNDLDNRMPPPPAAALSADQIVKIEKWIMQGAQNLTCTNSGCDSTNVSYSGKIWPIINNKCKGCHSGNAPGGNVLLTDYTNVAAAAVSGSLMGTITHAIGNNPMPKNSLKLSSCEIGIVRNWIAEGKQNN